MLKLSNVFLIRALSNWLLCLLATSLFCLWVAFSFQQRKYSKFARHFLGLRSGLGQFFRESSRWGLIITSCALAIEFNYVAFCARERKPCFTGGREPAQFAKRTQKRLNEKATEMVIGGLWVGTERRDSGHEASMWHHLTFVCPYRSPPFVCPYPISSMRNPLPKAALYLLIFLFPKYVFSALCQRSLYTAS